MRYAEECFRNRTFIFNDSPIIKRIASWSLFVGSTPGGAFLYLGSFVISRNAMAIVSINFLICPPDPLRKGSFAESDCIAVRLNYENRSLLIPNRL